jgi:hypothetical protein
MKHSPWNAVASPRPSAERAPGTRVVHRKWRQAVSAFCLISTFAQAQNRISEYAVKAAYLFNFGKFVRFTPSEAITERKNFDICIVGNDPFGRTLDGLTANERLDGKPVRVLRLNDVTEARSCAIAYISASEGTRIKSDVDTLRGQQVLTVSDAAQFLEQGGMIQFVIIENHVRFAVNLEGARGAQLSLSSELLKVAISVNGASLPEVRP